MFAFLVGESGTSGDYTFQVSWIRPQNYSFRKLQYIQMSTFQFGRMTSPLFSGSFAQCKVHYYTYLNGNLDGGHLEVMIHDTSVGKDIPIDRIYNEQLTTFTKRTVQIGKRTEPFRVSKILGFLKIKNTNLLK